MALRSGGKSDQGTAEIQAKVDVPASTSGQPMPEAVQQKMESAFSADFSDVRIHAGSARAVALGALAYTQGSDIHVAPGRWAPETMPGQELLGHELAHVQQQREGRVRATAQMKGVALNDDPALEREADVMGARAARGDVRSSPMMERNPWSPGVSYPRQEHLSGVADRRSAAVTSPLQAKAEIVNLLNPPDPNNPGGQLSQDQKYYDIAFGPLTNGCGTWVRANLNPEEFGAIQGSSPKVVPDWWPGIQQLSPLTRDWARNYLVQGHLLNEKLGGPGTDMRNLTPLTKSANSNHSSKIESNLKKLASQAAATQYNIYMIQYHVYADYTTSPTLANLGAPNDFAPLAQKMAHKIHAEYTTWATTQSGQKVELKTSPFSASWDIYNDKASLK